MADFLTAHNWTMNFEDPERMYEEVLDPVPVNEEDTSETVEAKKDAHAISGVNSFYFPGQFSGIAGTVQSERGAPVQSFYLSNFWNRWLELLDTDDLAMRVYDCGVNEGKGIEVKVLQTAINSLAKQTIGVDGDWGPETLGAANGCNSALLVSEFKAKRLERYEDIVKANPSLVRFLGTATNPGPWWIRAMK